MCFPRSISRFAALITLATAGLAAMASPTGWEPLKSDLPGSKSIVKEEEIEVKAAPGVIIVATAHQTKIRVFTILGRLVSSETIPPGVSRFNVPAHGVYIVTVGDGVTVKVAV